MPILRLAVLMLASTLIMSLLPGFAQSVRITGAEVLDLETGRFEAADVAVVDGRIAAIGRDVRSALTGEVETVNLGGAYLLPGLSDSHVHLTSDARIHGYRRLAVSLPASAITGVANARKTLEAGFTTVRNVGARGYADVALRDAIANGTVPGPRMLVSGPSIGITGGHCDSNLLPFEYNDRSDGVADGPWAVREKVRQNVKYGADVIKFCGTGGVLSKGTRIGAQQFTYEEMAALVDEAHLLGLRVAVHAHGTQGINTAIRAGVDSVEHASLINDEGLALAKEKGTFLSMDIYVSDYILSEGEAAGILPESLAKERIVGQRQRESFQRAVEAGVKVAYGTDAGVYPHGTNARQLSYLVDWGLTPLEAIRTATLRNAELFGLEDDIGSIEVGKFADLIAVSANPLEDVSALETVDFVMKEGVVYVNRLAGN